MDKSKKEKRKDKAREKMIQSYFQNRKMHFQQYQIPPYNQEHLRALLLQFMAFEQFDYPLDHINIFAKIRSFYENTQNSDIYMKDLNLPVILKELAKEKCIEIVEEALGTKLVYMIRSIDHPKVVELAKQKSFERPLKSPPDPITFQQEKKQLVSRVQEGRDKMDALLQSKSLFDNDYDFSDRLGNNHQNQRIKLETCEHETRQRCQKIKGYSTCPKKHFRAIINQNTEESYGNCPHLNACHNPDCKLIHYMEEDHQNQLKEEKSLYRQRMNLAQWINCDLRHFDFSILGKFDVVMADPPWDIHMSLPYGTLKDKQMLGLRVDLLQDEGLMFLWVTGRAMELGRECLASWGYRRVDEIVWIKTNQINRLIITGKTGHWLNHTKEHCLVGVKGNPKIKKRMDCDVIVSKVRETSKKPDEIYGLIERMSPGGKKIELFGRPDNCMPGWLTLGNQLTNVRLKDAKIIENYKRCYPGSDLSAEQMKQNLEEMINQENLNKVYNSHIQKNNDTL